MKFKHIIAVLIVLVVLGFVEITNFWASPTIKRIHLPLGRAHLSIITHGFQDRTSYVYLEQSLAKPKCLFGFDPYQGGIYSFDVSTDGKMLRFQQSNEVLHVRFDDAIAVHSAPTDNVTYVSLIAPLTNEDVGGRYLWGFQFLWYP